MNIDELKKLKGTILTKELQSELIGFYGNSVMKCVKDHTAYFNSGLTDRTSKYKKGDTDRINYIDFEKDTYNCWVIESIVSKY